MSTLLANKLFSNIFLHVSAFFTHFFFFQQEAVRRKQVQKEWEKQEKKLRELKAKGVTQKNAEKAQLKSKSREPGKFCDFNCLI